MGTFQYKQSLKGKHAMTEAKQVLYTPVAEDGEYIDFEPDAKMAEENEEFEQFKAEMHDAQFDAKITVGKKMTDSQGRPLGRQIFECFECAVNDYTFSQLCTRIREDFGTGLYQIHGRDSKGKYKFKKTVGILAPNQTDNVPAGNDVGQLIDKFSDAMARQQMQTEQMFKSLQGPQTGGDAFDQMTKLMTAMGAMMGTMGIQPQAPIAPKTITETLMEFKLMKELMGELGGGSDEAGGGNLMGLLTATVQNIGPLLGAALAQGQKAGTVNADGIVKAIASPPEKESTVVDEKSDEQKQVDAIKPQVAFLIKQINGNAEPEAVADFMVDLIPDDQLENVEAFLKQENYFDVCILADPQIEQHREWIEEWRYSMLNNLTIILDIGDPAPEEDQLTETSNESKTDEVVGSDTIQDDTLASSNNGDAPHAEPIDP